MRRLGAFAAVLVLAACGGGSSTVAEPEGAPAAPSTERGTPSLTDLESVEELRAIFNADRGRPRLLVLLSPT